MTNQFNQIIFLGTGTSTGIPMIGCSCPVCLSDDPKDKRLRCSVYITTDKGHSFIIDTGPDLRTQLLREKITSLDFALITHCHADHLHGIDDLRPFTFFPKRKDFPILCDQMHKREITEKFAYIFRRDEIFNDKNPYQGGGLPLLNLHTLDEIKNFSFSNEDFEFFLLPHGTGKTVGFRHSKMAYLIDCHEVPKEVIKKLKSQQLELLIIDCLQISDHPSHLNVSKTFDYIEKISPKRALLTHMNHELSDKALNKGFTSLSSLSKI